MRPALAAACQNPWEIQQFGCNEDQNPWKIQQSWFHSRPKSLENTPGKYSSLGSTADRSPWKYSSFGSTRTEIPRNIRCGEKPRSSLTLQSLLFSISLLFVFRFSLLFLAFFLPFPRILGVPRREKPLLFLGKNPCFFQKSKVWRVRAWNTTL